MKRSSQLSLALGLTLSAACQAGAGPAPRQMPPAPPSTPASAAAAKSTSAPPASSVRFEPRPGPVLRADLGAADAAKIAFRKPSADALLAPADALRFVVEIEADLSRLGPGANVEVSLDGRRPRRVPERGLALALLSPDGRDLAAGPHSLIAAAVDVNGRLIRVQAGKAVATSVRFWVGARGAPSEPPELVCWGPNGTYYGSAAEPALDVLLTADGGMLSAALEGPASARSSIDAAQPWGILGLMSGDYRLLVELPNRGASAAAECRFTVNRETERPTP